MEKEICFNIEDKELYTDRILVSDVYDIPLFFLCIDSSGQQYAVLCAGNEEDRYGRYIVTLISKKDMKDLLDGKLPMRNVMFLQETYWEVHTGEKGTCEDDIVTVCRTSEIDRDILPQAGACFWNSDSSCF